MVVAPGEPLPPGFEGEVEETKTLIQDRLDKFNVGPLVGLEYLLELLDYDPSKEPTYMCILCHKKGDPRTILTHLASYNHQVAYLQKHFPTAYRHIAPYMIKVYKRNWQAGLQKIADAIESTFGRLKPIQVEAGKFNKDSMYYVELVAKGKHFSELSGQTFENVVTKEELTKVYEEPKKPAQQALNKPAKRKSPSPPVVAKPMKRPKAQVENVPKRRSLSPVSDVSSSDLEDFDVKSPVKPSRTNESFRKGRPGVNSNSSFSRKEGAMPWQKSSYRRDRPISVSERSRDEKAEKMEEFKRLAKAIDNQMELVLKKHKENPEKHPKYNDEWKKFWNARYKELQAEGKNAATHDFKPEWIEYWNKRILELHQEEVISSKAALRKRLGLEEPAPISFKIGERRKPVSSGSKPVPTAAQPDNDPEVIVIDDNDDDNVGRGRKRPGSPFRRKDRSPQFRRRSPPNIKDSPPSRRRGSPSPIPSYRRKDSPPPRRRESPPPRRKESPLSRRRDSPISRRPSPPSLRIRDSPKRQMSPLSRRKSSPSFHRAPSPPLKIKEDKIPPSPMRDRSPRRDKFERLRDRSEERSRSRGKSREISWERERERRRDYDEKHWDRAYRPRDPWELEHHYPIDPYAPPKVLRDVTRKPVTVPHMDEPEDDGEVNIVAVLRLLTALEEKLGSLGPKVIDLLGQALAMEKKVANSSEELLDSEMNCVLFETVKEKLKGQLQAGLVDWIQEKAFKNAIKKTASLIHIASERKKQKEQELPKKPVVVPGIGKVDKGKIARQIANALIAQGKTDVTQDELEELINAVVGIAEAQKNSTETLTTASFLEKLANSHSTTVEKTEPKVETKPVEREENEQPVEKLDEDHEASSSSQDKTVINMEGLSDSDLETLLQNFKDLSNDEQLGLINYLKKLEAKEPERVEKLRKFVNLTENLEEKTDNERYSPFLAKIEESSGKTEEPESIVEKSKEEDNSGFVDIDSEDEYSFEDVAKAVSQKVKESEKEQKRKEDKNLDDAKAFITSLMSSLNKNITNSTASTTSSPSITTPNKNMSDKINVISNLPVSSADIAKSLSGITMSVSSLGNILGNVQSMANSKIQAERLIQEPKPINQIPASVPPTNVPSVPPSFARNSYNEFDIASQRDVRNPAEYNPQGFAKGRPNKNYDEFNIGPIPRDVKDDVRESRMQGALSGRGPEKPPGFKDMPPSSNSPYLDRPHQSDVNSPYSHMQGAPLRGNTIRDRPLDRPSMQPVDRPALQPLDRPMERPSMQPLSGKYPQRGGPFPGKLRPAGNNFEPSAGRGDFGPRDDYRGGMSDFRGGMGNFRGMTTDYRAGPDEYGPDDYREEQTTYRGKDYRDMRGPQGNIPGPVDEMRPKGNNFAYSGGGQAFKGGNFSNANRPNNFAPAPPRYPGSSNYNSPFSRW
ncbi:uncharacterized protein CG7065-like isoform X2 [Coccinella septempunctata]|nr:uncharacterized protein CG7065-like isoform X2 [Coccinella septempunctata]